MSIDPDLVRFFLFTLGFTILGVTFEIGRLYRTAIKYAPKGALGLLPLHVTGVSVVLLSYVVWTMVEVYARLHEPATWRIVVGPLLYVVTLVVLLFVLLFERKRIDTHRIGRDLKPPIVPERRQRDTGPPKGMRNRRGE